MDDDGSPRNGPGDGGRVGDVAGDELVRRVGRRRGAVEPDDMPVGPEGAGELLKTTPSARGLP